MRFTALFCTFLLGFVLLGIPASSSAEARITVAFGPPALPVYEQPVCPGDGFIWVPGYWAWDPDAYDYYWVPGTWVEPPEIGFLWTPPWWGWDDGVFVFNEGYWGTVVGFYGGIDYGFGYFGYGFLGGRWEHGHFYYNRAVTNINVVNVHNVYDEAVNHVSVNRISYNGGNGGIEARPRPEDERAAHGREIPAVRGQIEQLDKARQNQELRASVNRGRPPIAATVRAGDFSGREVIGAREAGAPYHPPLNRRSPVENRNRIPVHPSELPPLERPTAPNTGNAQLDQEYRKQQEDLFNRQIRERENLQREQEQEHQQTDRRNASQAERQQMEMRHQQQTEAVQRRQMQEVQRMQSRQRPGRPR